MIKLGDLHISFQLYDCDESANGQKQVFPESLGEPTPFNCVGQNGMGFVFVLLNYTALSPHSDLPLLLDISC